MLGIIDRLATGRSDIGRILLAFMAIGFGSLLMAGVSAAWIMSRSQDHRAAVNHTYEVELAIATARRLVEQGETARRGYLLTADGQYLGVYADSRRELPRVVGRLSRLTRDNPQQQAAIADLRSRLTELISARQRSIALVSAGDQAAAIAGFRMETGARRLRAIRNRFDVMGDEERRLLAVREAEQRSSVATFYMVLLTAGLILMAVAVISLLTVLRYTRDLAASRDRLRVMNDTLEEQVAERTSDLTRANEEIQRFAYIVSHDLRSPLVNVMGFTSELEEAIVPLGDLVDRTERDAPRMLTDQARSAVRQDLPEAIGFIRSSTQKMDRLIAAILRLAREGRRTIVAETIDLPALVNGSIAAMRQVVDERGAEVTVERPMPMLVSDRLALEQIVANLIENATKYPHPGRPGRIKVSATIDRGRVVIAVADNGRGIAPEDHQRIFDLFRRSGRQDQPGEGIGLAHVRALAYRLGGTIDVVSSLGEGATFRVTLPATPQSTQDPA